MKTTLIIAAIMIFATSSAFSDETFIISTSCGGGFAATHNISSINQDGVVSRKVVSFVIPDQNKEEEIIGCINKSDTEQLYLRLMKMDFMNFNYTQPHNFSCSMSLAVNNRTHSVTWPGMFNSKSGRDRPPELIVPVLDIFRDITKLLAPINENKTRNE
ncbi:MAG TPA: hypothetical protein VN604_00145 [Nitrospirota bacterium]|nr:hypothetical protein [Nitrospirota bacterium]